MISETWYLEYDPDDKKTANKIRKAKLADYTPHNLNKENRIAHFFGSNGEYYETTMLFCDCGTNPKPCKHMFRLAMELGLIQTTFESSDEPNEFYQSLSQTEKRQYALEWVVDLLEPNYEYLQFARSLIGSGGQYCKDITPYSVFVDNGMVRLERASQYFLSSITVTEIRNRLEEKGYQPADNQKITRAYINDHADEICELLLPNAYYVTPDGYLSKAPNKIREYLMYRLKEKNIEVDPIIQLVQLNEARYGEFKPDYTY